MLLLYGTLEYHCCSHAIIPYLLDKYAKDDSIYPRDLALRARINALLHFDNAILYTRVRDMSVSKYATCFAVLTKKLF